tara:strand:+ start:2421 stop:2762 length:342 start_codon:yes stop_codon:yes gene_type:complete
MNSEREDEIIALRKQKKLDRQAESDARKVKEAQELKSHIANMARIAKKVARIASGKNTVVEEPVVEEPVVKKVIEEPVAKLTPEPKKKAAVKKPTVKAKGKPKGRPKGKTNKK